MIYFRLPLIPLFLFLVVITKQASAGLTPQERVKAQINKIIQAVHAEVGVAIIHLETKETLVFNGESRFPMQSVYKFHLALAVLHQVDKGILKLDQSIMVTRLDKNTHSPMLHDYPNQDFNITLRKLLQYTVTQSDNNACDILFNLVGGPKVVHAYIQGLGISGTAITATEAEMKKDWRVQFTNWTTPLAAAQVLQQFEKYDILSPASHDFLWKLLVAASKTDRLKGQLPTAIVVAHKPGTSSRNTQGITAAFNDIGLIRLPNGNKVAIAIFVSNSPETDTANAKLIADIAKITWDYFTTKY